MNSLERKLHLRVLTPMRAAYDGPVDLLIARTTDGDLGVMYGHEPCSALLDDGILRIFPDKREQEQELLMVLGGILTVQGNEAVITSDVVEHPDRLQDYLDKLTEEREENVRKEQIADLQSHRLERAIRQALVHVEVNPYNAIRRPEDRSI